MKRSLILLASTAIALIFGACNQHSWDEGTEAQPPTKDVFKPHGHGDDHANGEGHAGEGKKEEAH